MPIWNSSDQVWYPIYEYEYEYAGMKEYEYAQLQSCSARDC